MHRAVERSSQVQLTVAVLEQDSPALVAAFFLGGWRGPLLPGPVWLLIKVVAVALVMVWIRGTLPRLRYDQLMSLGWKVLIPLALVNIVVTGAVMLL